MPFKVLKNAGFAPPEVVLLHEGAALASALQAENDPEKRLALRQTLSELEQRIVLRLEAMSSHGSL